MKVVEDVMGPAVVSVRTDTPVKEIVRRMDASGSSALPVVDERDRLVGMVSETELLPIEATHSEGSNWLALWLRPRERESGRTAGEIMDRHPASVGLHDPIADAANIMLDDRVLRIPVVDASGRLVGVVSWRDILQIFLRPDTALRADIVEWIEGPMCQPPYSVGVSVRNGVVTLSGEAERSSIIPLIVEHVRSVEGVVAVENHLGFTIPDAKPRAAVAPHLVTR